MAGANHRHSAWSQPFNSQTFIQTKRGSIHGLGLNINIPGVDPTDLVFSYFPGFLRPVADAATGQHVSQEQGVDQSGLAQA